MIKIPFKDVPDRQGFSDVINWVAVNITNTGSDDSRFGPNNSIICKQMTEMLYHYMQYKGQDVSNPTDLSSYSDSAIVSSWAEPAVQGAVGRGLVEGQNGQFLDLKGSSTRAQVATILQRFSQSA